MPKHRNTVRQTKFNKPVAKQEAQQLKTSNKKDDDPQNSLLNKLMNIDQFFSIPTRAVIFNLTDYFLLLFATIISLTTHLLKIGEPSSVVFDEVYFGNFTNFYHYGEYYFDIHPPLGKLLLYAGSLISGYKAKEVYSRIGAPLNPREIMKLRIWPALFGSLRSPILFVTLKFLNVSPQWCFTVALIISLDNALLVESRLVLIEAFLSFFACLTLLATSIIIRKPEKRKVNIYLICVLAGLSAGATVSIKFTGSGVAVMLVFAIFINYPFIEAFKMSFICAISGFFVFFIQFIIHFHLLPRRGDGCRFQPFYCAYLQYSPSLNQSTNARYESYQNQHKKRGIVYYIVDLIRVMLSSNFAIHVQHSYSSKWWQWPLMCGKMTYLWVEQNKQLWCIGNPIVWYSGLIGIITWVISSFFKFDVRVNLWVFFGYMISYLPFSLIKRVMWNYHYFIPLLISLVAGALAANSIRPRAIIVPSLICAASFALYIVYFPLTYGTPLYYERFLKIVPKGWRY
ncbi:hypothetical protein M9Y10_041805 [Tritrichomonas musculus]|uniref:Dolichyl-phosphate-mannose--protein mannosyltransferase n=2 Tax=Tritrichomonas musculus TaxID=1915356 RepID=A0ABR2K5E0_9EUKA